MRLFKTQMWAYAVLLVLLLAVATRAVWETITYIWEHIPEDQYRTVAGMIIVITLGFMLIAGAFGLWAIQFSARVESLRRVGRLVDAMDYMKDGLLSVDTKGHVTGSNPAAKILTPIDLERGTPIREAFPCLSEEDQSALLGSREPNEVERECILDNVSRTLRFRSQPSEGLTLVLVSDVSSMEARRLYSRHVARLQLIGQIARGVAHDFNNILMGISGHATVLRRSSDHSPQVEDSAQAIGAEAEKGIAMARHLIELTQPGFAGHPTDRVEEHIMVAADALRDSLASDWTVVHKTAETFPLVGLTGIQIEQIVFNLGILAADSAPQPGTLRISAGLRDSSPLFNIPQKFACAILISTMPGEAMVFTPQSSAESESDHSGVIRPVLQSMLEESGGLLETTKAHDGSTAFRVALPYARKIEPDEDILGIPDGLIDYLAHWSILLALPHHHYAALEKRMTQLNIRVIRAETVVAALGCIENDPFDAVVIDKHLLGAEARAVLKAILKLSRNAAIVVVCEDPESEPAELMSEIVFVQERSHPNKVLTAMVEAKSLAVARKTRAKTRS